jgi:hypothetical protein
MRKLKRKKNGSTTNWPSELELVKNEKTWRNRSAVCAQVTPCPKKTSTAQTIVTTTRMRQTSFHAERQNAERRRATTSSARRSGLSVPNRLGHSMKRRKLTSTSPRKAATSITVSRRA